MNTRLEYMYRDGENYKQHGEAVVAGMICLAHLQPYYYEGEFFVPSEVGLADLQEAPYLACDHVWHTMCAAEPTEAEPTAEVTASELLARFRAAADISWNTKTVNDRMMDF